MGEMAEDVIEGACCAYCNTYFDEEHGYPVLCMECWRSATSKEKEEYREATEREM